MKNLLINYISGDKIFESLDLEIYFKSLKNVTDADKFVLTNNVSKENLSKLESIYDTVVFGEAPGLQALPVAFIPINVTCNEPPSLVGCDPEICTVFESTRETIKRPVEFVVMLIPVV